MELPGEQRSKMGKVAQQRGLFCQACASTEFEGYAVKRSSDGLVVVLLLCQYCGLDTSLKLSPGEAQGFGLDPLT